jgi:hypothetical protein
MRTNIRGGREMVNRLRLMRPWARVLSVAAAVAVILAFVSGASLVLARSSQNEAEKTVNLEMVLKEVSEGKAAVEDVREAVVALSGRLETLDGGGGGTVEEMLQKIFDKVSCLKCDEVVPLTAAGEPLVRTCLCTNWDELVSPPGIICFLPEGAEIETKSDVFYAPTPDVNGEWTRVPGLGKDHPMVKLAGPLYVWAPWGMSVNILKEPPGLQDIPWVPEVNPGQEPEHQVNPK